MDPLTHATAGALGGRIVGDRLPERTALLFCVIGAVIPDIDNFIGLVDPELYLIHHRGITHSFLGGMAIALLLTSAFRLRVGSFPRLRGFLVSYAAITSHIFLDLITSWGTQIFAPASHRRYTVECVFIIDPIFTLSLAIFLWASFRSHTRRRALAAAGILWMVLYPVLNLGIREGVRARVGEMLARDGIACTRLHVATEVMTPFFWKVIAEEGGAYRLAEFTLLRPGRTLAFHDYRRADRELLEKLGERAAFFRTWAWFAEYPVMAESEAAGGRRITFGDLRFHSLSPLTAGLPRRSEEVFSLTAELDSEGRLVAYEYNRPRGARIIQHLE